MEGDHEFQEQSGEEVEQYMETGSEEVDLKEQVSIKIFGNFLPKGKQNVSLSEDVNIIGIAST